VATRAKDVHPVDPPVVDGTVRAAKPRVSVKGEQTRARLIAAARLLLADQQVPFTTRNVAARAGVTHGMCHYHFTDRTDLILAVVEDIRPEWILPLEEAVSSPGSFAQRAERVVEFFSEPEGDDLATLYSSLHWFALNDARVRESWEAEYRRWRAAFVALFRVLTDELGNGVDPRPLGDAAASGVDGLAAIRSLHADVDSPAVVRALIHGLARGAERP
jgi:AcrR family transcriptional regulator